MRSFKNILVTGGAGFIGANFIRYLFAREEFTGRIINCDKLTYAGNLASLAAVNEQFGGSRYFFAQHDICDAEAITRTLQQYDIDCVVHFAAESHVDRSITGPQAFVQTNVVGTFVLLEACRHYWGARDDVLFHGVSTDEVYGSLGDTGLFREDTAYDPHSPYSASKAASDHFINAYASTYGLPITLSNCSNNYGPLQFPEKLIPLMILKIMQGEALPVYGEGKNVRDWLYVRDHADAVWQIMQRGRLGQSYNVGGKCELQNIEVVQQLCTIVSRVLGKDPQAAIERICHVADRPGHDWRYAIDTSKIEAEIGWQPSVTFAQGIEQTVQWYVENAAWIASVQSGEYRNWLQQNYASRAL